MDDNAIVDISTSATKTVSAPLLLSSLDSFWSLLKPLLDNLRPDSLCEIGIGDGAFCVRLIEYCAQINAQYTGIDPTVSDGFVSAHQSPCAAFVRTPSLEALPGVDRQAVYIVDGDHNYYTVQSELRLITRPPDGHAPLIILHDVCWPWARRDQYCAPDSIPEAYRHEHATNGGVQPGRSSLQEDGFKGAESDYHYAAATHEGGARNGVLTAVEDFINSPGNKGWKLIVIPAIFGMGILFRPDALPPQTVGHLASLETALTPFTALLELLETNRLKLFLDFKRNLKHIGALSDEYKTLLAQYKKLATHASDLLKAWHGLKAHADNLETQIKQLKAGHPHD